jgi:hypothetical protein
MECGLGQQQSDGSHVFIMLLSDKGPFISQVHTRHERLQLYKMTKMRKLSSGSSHVLPASSVMLLCVPSTLLLGRSTVRSWLGLLHICTLHMP